MDPILIGVAIVALAVIGKYFIDVVKKAYIEITTKHSGWLAGTIALELALAVYITNANIFELFNLEVAGPRIIGNLITGVLAALGTSGLYDIIKEISAAKETKMKVAMLSEINSGDTPVEELLTDETTVE